MSDSEKLTALKKAYADIILNTAKEAAARIMASERKAIRYQQELVAAKDEALRMLLRLKQMLDDKVNEAQVASLCQQRKIEELEAQLGEAEDIVKDLRAELREAQDELEKATNDRTQLLQEQNSKVTNLASTSPEKKPNNSTQNSDGNIAMDVGLNSSETTIVTNSALKVTNEGKECHNENSSHKENCYFCNTDFASIVMRRKEPKLYRNGCTQRIRALERNLLDAKLRNETSVEEDKEDVYKKIDHSGEEMCGEGKSPSESETMQGDGNHVLVHIVKSFDKKRKRAGRYKKRKSFSFKNFSGTAVVPIQKNDIPLEEDSEILETKSEDSKILENKSEDSKILETKSENNRESSHSESSPLLKLPLEDSKGVLEISKAVNDKFSIDTTLGETRQESGLAESSKDLETVNACLVNKDGQVSNVSEGVPTLQSNGRFLKYTFQRKRKKESLSRPDGDSVVKERTVQRKTNEKKNGSLESESSSLVAQSFQDSSQLAEVAQQLISLRRSGGSSSFTGVEGKT